MSTRYNTGNPIESTDVRDMSDNAKNLDLVLNSDGVTFVDRLGVERLTIYGLIKQYGINPASFDFQSGGALNSGDNNKGVLWPIPSGGDGQYYLWRGVYPKIIPPGSSPATTGGISDAGWLPLGDIALRGDLSTTTGAGLVGTTLGGTVQYVLDSHDADIEIINGFFGATVNIADYADLKSAIAALPASGGTVYIPIGNFYAGDWTYNTDYMNRNDVSIIGEKMPVIAGDASSLTGGSIIEGRFNAFAHNFTVLNVGFDNGLDVVAARFGGATTEAADYPIGGGTWDAFAFAQPNMVTPLPARTGVHIENVICLCKNSNSLAHSFLAECIDGSSYVNNVTGIYGWYGSVLKVENTAVGLLRGFMASKYNVLIKSDSYAQAGNLQMDIIFASRYMPNITPHFTPPVPDHGIAVEAATSSTSGPIQINSAISKGGDVVAAGINSADVQISKLLVDGFDGAISKGLSVGKTGAFKRVTVGEYIANNMVDAVYCKHPIYNANEAQLKIGSLVMQNVSGNAVTAEDYGTVTVDSITGNNVNNLYKYIGNNSKIFVGNERVTGVTSVFNPAVTLNAGWVNFGGSQQVFKVRLANYGVELSGLIVATATPSSSVAVLPTNIGPFRDTRHLAYINRGGTRSFALVNVDSTNGIGIDDGTAPLAADYLSLDGVGWVI